MIQHNILWLCSDLCRRLTAIGKWIWVEEGIKDLIWIVINVLNQRKTIRKLIYKEVVDLVMSHATLAYGLRKSVRLNTWEYQYRKWDWGKNDICVNWIWFVRIFILQKVIMRYLLLLQKHGSTRRYCWRWEVRIWSTVIEFVWNFCAFLPSYSITLLKFTDTWIETPRLV